MRAIYITSDEERAGVEEYRSTKENDREYHRDKRKATNEEGSRKRKT